VDRAIHVLNHDPNVLKLPKHGFSLPFPF
jgi:hypothetical protein